MNFITKIFIAAIKWYIKIHLLFAAFITRFFILTRIGQSLYVFLILYGFFTCENETCAASNFLCGVFVFYIMESCSAIWVYSRLLRNTKLFQSLIQEDVAKKYLDFDTRYLLIKCYFPFFFIIFLDMLGSYYEHSQKMSDARKVMEDFWSNSDKSVDMESKEYKDARRLQYYYLNKQTNGPLKNLMRWIFIKT